MACPCLLRFDTILYADSFSGSDPLVELPRRLGTVMNQQSVLNPFVDKYPLNEFDPDLKDSTVPMNGTHRTKGQLEVIARFIGSVAASFRMRLDVEQRLVLSEPGMAAT